MSLSVVERLGASANDSAWLVQRGRHLEATLLLGVGADSYLLRIHRGRVEAVEHGPFVMPRWTFALKASSEAWATFWQPVPPPGCHDLIAMIKTRRLSIEGDLHPFFANLRYFKELLALPRTFLAGAQRGTQ